MDRRNFLGSVIGSLAIAKIPFIAEPEHIINKSFNKFNLIDLTNQELIDNIAGVIYAGFNDLHPIKASDIINIERRIINDIAILEFKYDDINATQAFKTDGCCLVWKDNQEIIGNIAKFHYGQQFLISGDTLKVNHSIQITGLSEKQLITFDDNSR